MAPLWLSSPLKRAATPAPSKTVSFSILKRAVKKAAGASSKATGFTCPAPFRTGHIPMGGRFGKYGDAKRKARLRKSRLTPADLRQRAKEKTSQEKPSGYGKGAKRKKG
jgi:hypothetical protein